MKLKHVLLAALLFSTGAIAGNSKVVEITNLQTGESSGTVTITSHPFGTVFTPDLHNLPSGNHGFHVHEIAACGSKQKDGEMVPGGAAGGHYDPSNTNRHGEPWDLQAHRGDLPALYVDENGNATQPVLSPKLSFKELKQRSLMVHVHGDNYSDNPKPSGGGGARLACGVIN